MEGRRAASVDAGREWGCSVHCGDQGRISVSSEADGVEECLGRRNSKCECPEAGVAALVRQGG